MKAYKKSPNHDVVMLPGIGRLRPDRVLTGDHWGKFATMGLLVECEMPVAPAAPAPAPVIVPVAAVAPVPDNAVDDLEVIAPVPAKKAAKK